MNTKAFEKSIRNSDGLKKTFDKLDSESLEKLKETNNIVEKTIDIKAKNDNNFNLIMEKFKDYRIDDINNFIDRLTEHLRLNTGDNKCLISDWYKIIRRDGKCVDKFTFEIHTNNIFAIFGRNEDIKGKLITNICGFKSISDFDDLIIDNYECDHFVKD